MNQQNGFTAIEMVIVIAGGTAIVGAIAVIWIVTHFVAKLW
jgi:Tfp pilus assembly protein PilE